MTQALLQNFGVLIVILACLFTTGNPLVLFALLLIKELPYGLVLAGRDDDDEDDDRPGKPGPMGFTPS